jgi:hypothetical protein
VELANATPAWMPPEGPAGIMAQVDCGVRSWGGAAASSGAGIGGAYPAETPGSSSGFCPPHHAASALRPEVGSTRCSGDGGCEGTTLRFPGPGCAGVDAEVHTVALRVEHPDAGSQVLWDQRVVPTAADVNAGELLVQGQDGLRSVKLRLSRPDSCGAALVRITPMEAQLDHAPPGASSWNPDGTIPSVALRIDCGALMESAPSPGPRAVYVAGYCVMPEAELLGSGFQLSALLDRGVVTAAEASFVPRNLGVEVGPASVTGSGEVDSFELEFTQEPLVCGYRV